MRSRRIERDVLQELRLIREELRLLNENLRSLVNVQMYQNMPQIGPQTSPFMPPITYTIATGDSGNDQQ